LNAANNLDNNKPMDIPAPLINPKEIAAMVIEKQKKAQLEELQRQAQKEKDDFGSNLFNMSQKLLTEAS
jgi:hypothetical protein